MQDDQLTLVSDYIIPDDQISQFVSPESYLVTDPEAGVTWVYYNGQPIVELGRKKVLDSVWVHPEPKYQFGRCKMIKSDGERCRQPVRSGWTVCKYHGAGSADTPAGRPPINGHYSKHLPSRYFSDYQEYLQDPNLLSMRREMALIDVRLGEMLQMLETSDSPQAWNRISVACAMLEKAVGDGKFDELPKIAEILRNAITAHKNDQDIWSNVLNLIDNRRKVADVERRRIEAMKKYLTMQEANAMMAYFVDSVMKRVSSPQERALISEDLRQFVSRTE